MPGLSKSRNVNGYMKAVDKASRLREKLEAKASVFNERTAKLRQDLEEAKVDMRLRWAKLNGGQQAEARRLSLQGSTSDSR